MTSSESSRARSCAALRDRIPEIVAEWQHAVDGPPWSEVTAEQRVDNLPNFLRNLFDWAVCLDTNSVSARAFLEAAAEHGAQRRAIGFDYDVIMRESAVLRRVIWNCAKNTLDDVHSMVLIDATLTVGLMASLRGYSKRELVASGRWEDSLRQLAKEWATDLMPAGSP